MTQDLAAETCPTVEIDDVHKSYGTNPVLRGISLTVRRGEVVVLVGRSGSGKSTLLRCIDQLETIDAGSIRVAGQLIGYRERHGRRVRLSQSDIARQRTVLGMVFQHFNLFPHMTVLENIVAAPIRVRGVARRSAEAEAWHLLSRMGLADKGAAYPKQLSGGQQQRVAILRALAMQPKLMLFDEPTSALDPEMTDEVLEVMSDLSAQGMTMIVVSHEISFVRSAADRVIFLAEGRIIEDRPTADFLADPAEPRSRQFLSAILRH